jgi:hypothetical protein
MYQGGAFKAAQAPPLSSSGRWPKLPVVVAAAGSAAVQLAQLCLVEA